MMTSACIADDGASSVEYSLIAVAIAAVIVFVIAALGGYVKGDFRQTCTKFDQAGATNANTSGVTCDE